jgi:CHAD domain-containing protein
MSKACDTAFCALCAHAILDRVSTARGLIAAVVEARDIEAVHDMRVASRRLRAGLALFVPCLPSWARLWRKEVRRITRALGQARDLDVQIRTLAAAMQKHPAWGAGLGGISDSLKSRRLGAQQKVMKALARIGDDGVFEQIETALAPMARAMPKMGPAWKKAYRWAQEIILDLLGEMTAYETDLARPQAVARHHQMRIAAKRLRYSLEIFAPLYGRGVKPALQAAKQMQSLLGDMHDCDVWELALPELADGDLVGNTGKDMPATVAKSVAAFARDRCNQRQKLYRQARQYWQKCKKDHVWPKLRQTLRQAAAKKPLPQEPKRNAPKLTVKAGSPKNTPPAKTSAHGGGARSR